MTARPLLTLLAAAGLLLVGGGDHAAHAEVRITPDDRPGSYVRHDGTVDAIHRRCSTSRRQQQEASVAVNPRNPRIIAVGSMDACISERSPLPIAQAQNVLGYYLSDDGGENWSASLVPGHPWDESETGRRLRGDANCLHADPTLSFDNSGTLFYGYLCPDFDGPAPSDFFMYVAAYEEDGRRFRGAVRVDRPPPGTPDPEWAPDKPNLAVDQTDGAHAGNVYMVWTQCPHAHVAPCADPSTGGPPVVRATDQAYLQVVRSTDGGRSFDAPVDIPRTSAPFPQFADLTVGPDGTVYVAFRTKGSGAENAIWLSRSTDGGQTFSEPVQIAAVTRFDSAQYAGPEPRDPLQGTPCGDGSLSCASGYTYTPFRTLTAVAADERGVHVTFNERPEGESFGQSRVYVRTSPDGVSWPDPPVAVSPQPTGHQWMPDIASADGVLSVLFFDSRADQGFTLERMGDRPPPPPGNTIEGENSGPAVDAYVAQSRDGGRTWSERRLTSRSFQPNWETYLDARVPWLGDYLYISAVPGGVFGIWPDTRDVVAGEDTRPDSADNGFDVLAPCDWTPRTVMAPPSGYAHPPHSDPCLSQGGLDVNVYGARIGGARAQAGCLPTRLELGSRGLGRIRLGHGLARTARRAGPPTRRARRRAEYCVPGRGSVMLALPDRHLRLIGTTAPRHTARGVGAGDAVAWMFRRYPSAYRLAEGIYGTRRSSRVIFGVRGGRVTFVGVADRRGIKNVSRLQRWVRQAGLTAGRGGSRRPAR